MRLLLIGAVLLGVTGETVEAKRPKTPYEAIVIVDEVFVRSGPGKTAYYYPTGKLKRGDRVTVRREDPGSWCVIDPPPGSFSWIPTEFVKRVGNDRGAVTESIFVYIGSEFDVDDAHEVRHRIGKGEEVEILGEQTLQIPRGLVAMYKIKPPQNEYRHLPGDAVVPADAEFHKAAVAQRRQTSPFEDVAPPGGNFRTEPRDSRPSKTATAKRAKNAGQQAKTDKGDDRTLLERPLVRVPVDQKPGNNDAVRRRGPSPERIDAEQERLSRLDAQFRTIITQKTDRWNFTELEREYRQARQGASSPTLAGQVDLRLSALERYKTVKAEYDEYLHLTTATSQKEAQLAAMQRRQRSTPATAASTASPPAAPKGATRSPAPTAMPQQRSPRSAARFDGAGIIQRSATTYPGAPRHVLLTPSGRILAYLQAEQGINLDQYLGRAMGLHGKRSYRPELRTDLMTVRGLTPVRLRP